MLPRPRDLDYNPQNPKGRTALARGATATGPLLFEIKCLVVLSSERSTGALAPMQGPLQSAPPDIRSESNAI
jgi:hypothetical protein